MYNKIENNLKKEDNNLNQFLPAIGEAIKLLETEKSQSSSLRTLVTYLEMITEDIKQLKELQHEESLREQFNAINAFYDEFKQKLQSSALNKITKLLIQDKLKSLETFLLQQKTEQQKSLVEKKLESFTPQQRLHGLRLSQQHLEKNCKTALQELLHSINHYRLKQRYPGGSLYICYAWAHPDYQQEESWEQGFLATLREHLKAAGITAILDIKDNQLGNNIYKFMEQAKTSDYVLVVGSQSLLKKHKQGITALATELIEILDKRRLDEKQGLSRVLPILLSGEIDSALPSYFRIYTTVRSWVGEGYLRCLRQLIERIYNIPEEDKTAGPFNNLWQQFLTQHPNAQLSYQPLPDAEIEKVIPKPVQAVKHKPLINIQLLKYPLIFQGGENIRESLFRGHKKDMDVKVLLGETLPKDFKSGTSLAQGDCFFDSAAQSLSCIKNEHYTAKRLRLICKDYVVALDKEDRAENWIYQRFLAKAKRLSQDGNEAKQAADSEYQHYMANIGYTQNDIDKGAGLNIEQTIWGEQDIDGRILREKLNINLHVIEFHELEQQLIVSHQMNSKSVEGKNVDYVAQQDTVHIAVFNGHFVPLLPKTNVAMEDNEQPIKPLIFGIPSRGGMFVARKNKIQELNIKDKRKICFTGYSGAGKTQLAIEYASSSDNNYEIVIWFNTVINLDETIAEVYPKIVTDEERVVINQTCKSYELAQAIYKKISNKKTLIIFDDASSYTAIENYLPPGSQKNIHILVTSLNQAWAEDDFEVHNIIGFKRDESLEFIGNKLPNESKTEQENLARTLCDNPLVINQAIAYIVESNISINTALNTFNNAPKTILDWKVVASDNYLKDHPYAETAYKTLSASLLKIYEEAPLALATALLIANLAYFDIKDELLAEWLKSLTKSEVNVPVIKIKLREYAIIDDTKPDHIRMHALRQRVINLWFKNNKGELTKDNIGQNYYSLYAIAIIFSHYKISDLFSGGFTDVAKKNPEIIIHLAVAACNFAHEFEFRENLIVLSVDILSNMLANKWLTGVIDTFPVHSESFIETQLYKFLYTCFSIIPNGFFGLLIRYCGLLNCILKKILKDFVFPVCIKFLDVERLTSEELDKLATEYAASPQKLIKAISFFEDGIYFPYKIIGQWQKNLEQYKQKKLKEQNHGLTIAEFIINENKHALLPDTRIFISPNRLDKIFEGKIVDIEILEELSMRINASLIKYKICDDKIDSIKKALNNELKNLFKLDNAEGLFKGLSIWQELDRITINKQAWEALPSKIEGVINPMNPLILEGSQNTRKGLFRGHKRDTEVKQLLEKNLPIDFEPRASLAQGDCFFDSAAQSLSCIMKEHYTAKRLRLISKEYVIKLDKKSRAENWIYQRFLANAKQSNKDDNKAKENADSDYQHYMANIGYTQEEIDKGAGLNIQEALWGEQDIDGRILQEVLKIHLHMIEFHEVEGQLVASHQIDSKSVEVESINYAEANTVHIAVFNSHFVPLLPASAGMSDVSVDNFLKERGNNPSLYFKNEGILEIQLDNQKQAYQDCETLSKTAVPASNEKQKQQTLALCHRFFQTPIITSERQNEPALKQICEQANPLQEVELLPNAVQNIQPIGKLFNTLCHWLSSESASNLPNHGHDLQHNIQPK